MKIKVRERPTGAQDWIREFNPIHCDSDNEVIEALVSEAEQFSDDEIAGGITVGGDFQIGEEHLLVAIHSDGLGTWEAFDAEIKNFRHHQRTDAEVFIVECD